MSQPAYDAILFVSFGGPEGTQDVIPFLENVLRGRNVPHERMLAVAEHYYHFGGVSPINQQNRELIAAVKEQLPSAGIHLPVYWGNRNWHPMLVDTVAQMKKDGIQKAIAFVTSSTSSYSSCRQYRENIIDALELAGDGSLAIDKIRVFYNHPDFISANAARIEEARGHLPAENQNTFRLFFTAHSIPMSMANTSNYVQQLTEACRLVANTLQVPEDRWQLVYQSRSGRPEDPWLEPDILDSINALPANDKSGIIISPIGFLSDHMEILFDLDTEAADLCHERGIEMQRAGTVGTHPDFVRMIVKLIQERLESQPTREAVGKFPASHDFCAANCCPAPNRRPQTPAPGK